MWWHKGGEGLESGRGYEMIAIKRLESATDPPTLLQSFTQRKSLQRLLVQSITLLTFGLAIVLLWPFRGRFRGWISEPALWLFLIAIPAFLLIPPPLAFTLVIVAVTLPVINHLKKNVTTGRI